MAVRAKPSKAAVPLSITQLGVGLSPLCLHPIQDFAEYTLEYEVSMASTVSPPPFVCFHPSPGGTWKQEGHMVMEASGSRER